MISTTTVALEPPLQLVLRRSPDVDPALAGIQDHANLVLAHQARILAYAALEQTDLEKSTSTALAGAKKLREETGALQLQGAEEHRKRIEDDLAQLRRIMAAAEKFLEGQLAHSAERVQVSTDCLAQLTVTKENQERKIRQLEQDLLNIR